MDVNDNIPQFIRSYEFSIPEDTNTTTSVGQVSVTDDDLPSSNKIRYAIRSGGMGQFYMDPVTGTCTVKKLNISINEPRHEKTGFLHMRKQRCRSASR